MKRLIVNADDFGFTRDVNVGIVHAHRQGILTATTLMATGPAFEHAVELSRANPTLDVGVHLVLVGGAGYPPTVSTLMQAIALGRMRIEEELRAQIQKVLAAGIRPTHLDTHKHTHLLPPVLSAMARLSGEFQIPWIRRPFDLPLHAGGVPWTKRLVSKIMGFARRRFERTLAANGCRVTDHFAGFQITGRYNAAELAALIRSLPDGLTEFMCHPGFCTAELEASHTRLKESRRRELDALTSPEARAALDEAAVKLASYREIA